MDLDGDDDLDILVASLGVIFPNNAKIGSVVVLENDGRRSFTNRVLVDKVARVSDVRAGDLDGDGDLDLAVAQFGYDEARRAGWRTRRLAILEHLLQNLSGPINVEIGDLDGDGDLDITSLVSQEWEEIYAFVNDGRGHFTPHRIFGATNDDFGSSWLTLVDLDKDGDVDFLYSNGDAFDYAPPKGRGWHGVQWLENPGQLTFAITASRTSRRVEPASGRSRWRRRSRRGRRQRLQRLGRGRRRAWCGSRTTARSSSRCTTSRTRRRI